MEASPQAHGAVVPPLRAPRTDSDRIGCETVANGRPFNDVAMTRSPCARGVDRLSPSTTATGGSALEHHTEQIFGDARLLLAAQIPGRAAVAARPSALGADPPASTVVYVDDDIQSRELLTEFFRHWNRFEFVSVADVESARLAVERYRPAVVLVDRWLDGRSADEFVTELLAQDPAMPVVMLSADAQSAAIARLRRLGVADYLAKPLDLAHLSRVLTSLARREAVNPFASPGHNEEGSAIRAHTTAASRN
jgi:CheY-like chemotaxis protein